MCVLHIRMLHGVKTVWTYQRFTLKCLRPLVQTPEDGSENATTRTFSAAYFRDPDAGQQSKEE